ncbi:MAG: hypothetical protein H8D96_04180 [Desulfobacterales bacterium]|uniref:Uncharacterized protein n=1 Tax=Candidatus Desulfatibia vada TaxID=2841696 RepID=A0A8J6NZ32_9BACT|nr:hypothetical protein [Candidatus Desulfatibia vada]
MKINLKKWQADMLNELLEQFPANPAKALEEQVSVITYGDLSVGNGWYKQGRVEISPAIRHPRMLIERTLHECGHGIEEWLNKNGHALYAYNLEQIADGFALALLYPNILMEPQLKKIRKIYSESLFPEGFPSIDTENLIAKYVRHAEELMQKSFFKHGVKVSSLLSGLFDQQEDGFLRRYSTKANI